MDFLDQLKKETENKNVRDKVSQEALDRRAELFEQEASAAMQSCYKYLRKLTDTLVQTGYSVKVDYELENVGTLTGFNTGHYMLLPDNPTKINEIAFQYDCTGSQQIVFSRMSKANIDKQKKVLWQHGLRFDFKERMAGKIPKGDFFLEPWVLVKITFSVDEKAQKIKLTLKNLFDFEETSHILTPTKLNSDFLEQLARAISGKPNQLNKLLGRSVTDTLRMRLQQTLIEAAKQKGLSAPEKTHADEKKSVLSKIKTLFKKS